MGNNRLMAIETPRRETLTVDELADKLGVSRNTAYLAVRTGQVPAIKVGQRWLVLREPLERMLRGERKAAPS